MPRPSGRGGGTSRLRGRIGLLRSRAGTAESPPGRLGVHPLAGRGRARLIFLNCQSFQVGSHA
ncbi:hypothetical protein GZL_06174 [Streptomyces sp. 769]|nr:hypothetical protein GZL_06174 [Streptomyces sp. 769]